MSGAEAGDAHLEKVMYRLMDYLSGEKADQYDTMVMISLVNLLGIVSVMNKHWAAGAAAPRAMGENPLMGVLLKMLEGQQGREEARGGPPGLDPALLLSLLGPQARSPESALLLALLNRIMQPRPQGPPYPERAGEAPGSAPGGDRPAGNGLRDPRKGGGTLNWDRRLG